MLSLRVGESSVVVAPELGAGLTGWLLGGTAMFRRALPQTAIGRDVHAMGCFPLVPYGNRIGYARFRWQGQDYPLRHNFGDSPHTIHGVGWQRPWSVEETGTDFATLSLAHRPDPGWPFAFDAQVEYRLTARALRIALQVTNRHDGAVPAGIGIHPFFPKVNDPALRFNCAGAWDNGRDALPLRHGVPPQTWSHVTARSIARSRLDNCFTGWDGSADILAGPAGLRMEASAAFRNLQVFTPDWADFFCVEPVSHVPDALNHPALPADQSMHVLQPNETLSGTLSLTATGPSARSPNCSGHSRMASAASGPERISTNLT